jgi:sulfotransferase
LELVYASRRNYTEGQEFRAQRNDDLKKAFLGFCRGGMESYAAALTDKPYMVDKSRGWGIHYDLLKMIHDREPKILCMVRDLRQVLSSMEKKFRETPERHRAIENQRDLGGITTYKRALHNLQSPPIGLALERLAEIFQRGWAKHFLFVRYEDLTSKPEEAMKRVYNYLEVPFYHHDFHKIAQVTHEDDEVFGIPGLHIIRGVVEPNKVDFMQVLGADVLRHVYSKYGWYFRTFGYTLPTAKKPESKPETRSEATSAIANV